MPYFSSFDDAWRWFAGGGELTPIAGERERITAGRAQLLAFIAPLGDPALLAEVRAVQEALADLDGVTPTPEEDLHATVRVLGFQVIEKRRPDDLLPAEVQRSAADAGRLLAAVAPVRLTAGPVNVFPSAVVLEVRDGGALAALRTGLAPSGAPEPADAPPFLPHVTVATFGSSEAGTALRERLPALRARPPVAVTVRRIELVRAWFTGLDADAEPEIDVVRSYALRGA